MRHSTKRKLVRKIDSINEREFKREENLYKKLPLLIKEIILDSSLPLPTLKESVLMEIEEIKRITNAECESALEILRKNNKIFKN